MASPYGTPVEFKRERAKIRNRVHRIGIEVEGGWTTLPPGTRPIRDGSLDPFAAELALQLGGTTRPTHGHPSVIFDSLGRTVATVGEIASQILEVRELEPWMRTFYPQHCNHERCGLHLHMSFGDARYYSLLGDDRYGATIVNGIIQWAQVNNLPATHPLWPRLRGESIYCQHVFDFDGQVQNTHKDFDQRRPGHRYTAINYGFQAHGTIECRLLTMFDTVDLAISALKEIIYITNAFLVETAVREKKVSAEVEAEGGSVIEERRIYV